MVRLGGLFLPFYELFVRSSVAKMQDNRIRISAFALHYLTVAAVAHAIGCFVMQPIA